MNILYAEDDVDDFFFFNEIAKEINPNTRCINTRNGLETIEYLEKSVALPDLIVLDINMPAMDGKACLKNVKNDPKFRNIPVIIYSTTILPRDKMHCLQLGALECIQKPNSALEAHSRLSKYLS